MRLARCEPTTIAAHLRTLLRECMVAPIFDALSKMAEALGTHLQAVVRWVGDESAPLDTTAMRAALRSSAASVALLPAHTVGGSARSGDLCDGGRRRGLAPGRGRRQRWRRNHVSGTSVARAPASLDFLQE